MEEIKTTQPTAEKKETPPQKKKVDPSKKKKSPTEDFKRRYFDYYDDIKISDRQDW